MNKISAIAFLGLGFSGLVSAGNAPQEHGRHLPEILALDHALFDEEAASLIVTDRESFQSEFDKQIEEVSPDVFLFIDGIFKGTTVAFGLNGVRHEIASHSARLMTEPKAPKQGDLNRELERLRELEADFERNAQQSKGTGYVSGICTIRDHSVWPPNSYMVNYNLSVVVNAGLFMVREDGTLNPRYARAQAGSSAYSYGYLPWNLSHPVGGGSAFTRNVLTGISQGGAGWHLAESFSGPSFGHNMSAYASASMGFPCTDFISVDAVFTF